MVDEASTARLPFGEALEGALKRGERIRRIGWPRMQYIVLSHEGRPDPEGHPWIKLHYTEGVEAAWQLNTPDILADDWVVVVE